MSLYIFYLRLGGGWGVQLIHTNMRKLKGGQIYPFDDLNDHLIVKGKEKYLLSQFF